MGCRSPTDHEGPVVRARLVSGGPWSMLGIIYAGTSNLLYGARPATGQGEGREGLAEATVLAWPMRRRQPFSGVAIPWSRNGGRWMAASGLRQGRES